jgi:hypothetical protein
MSQPVGYGWSAHALSWRDCILWHHGSSPGSATTVLSVKSTLRLKVEGAKPFHVGADFTHVAVQVNHIPFTLLFDADNGHNIPCWSERHNGE